MSSSDGAGVRWYNGVWRWHFYAGVFCIPFVIWLSLTGSIYLWRPQIEALFDRLYDHLTTTGEMASPDAQVAAALAAVPGATLHRYVMPEADHQATRILVAKDGEDWRVMVDPRSRAVLDVVREESRPLRLVFHLHGELLAGAVGSYLVEIAACWSVVMLLTGLFLWWPRGPARLAGVLYPRLRAGPRLFWRDLHATAGLWVSLLALGLILTGLPWAKGWGTYLAEVRALTGTAHGPVDWTIGGRPPKQDAMLSDHIGHMTDRRADTMSMKPVASSAPGDLARIIATASPLDLAPPVNLTPPRRAGAPWVVASDAADRPLRVTLEVDGATGKVLRRTDFAQRHWIDRAVGYGVAAHEGQLFGLANQILGTATALFLVVLAISGVVLWWRRRPAGVLGAPAPRGRPRFALGLIAAVAALAITMPMFGLTLVVVLLVESFVLRRSVRARIWLGLASAGASLGAAPR